MAVSELPGYPSAVWTIKGRHDDPADKYIVVSFTNATLVLAIGETVEEVTTSGLLARAPTLCVQLLADNSIIQVGGGGGGGGGCPKALNPNPDLSNSMIQW
jgi:splicing factor 3B subunit 3